MEQQKRMKKKLRIRHMANLGVPQIRGTLLGGPYSNKDRSIFGSMFGSPSLGKQPICSRTFYVRVLVHADLCGPLRRACPDSCSKLVQSCVVVEMSCCPPERAERMMSLL